MSIAEFLLYLVGGAFVGSFLGVVVRRVYEGKSGIMVGRSECPLCGHKLGAGELVPVWSYVYQRGKCKHCGGRIGWFYPGIELVTAVVFVGMGSLSIGWMSLIYWLAVGSLLVLIAFFDLRYRVLPDDFSIYLGGVALVGMFLGLGAEWWEAVWAVALVTVFFGGQVLLSRGEWLGTGDLVLGLALALLVGWPGILILLVVGYTAGAAVAVGLLAGGYVKKGAQLPFAPFLVGGALVTLIWGEKIVDYYWNCQVLGICNFMQ